MFASIVADTFSPQLFFIETQEMQLNQRVVKETENFILGKKFETLTH